MQRTAEVPAEVLQIGDVGTGKVCEADNVRGSVTVQRDKEWTKTDGQCAGATGINALWDSVISKMTTPDCPAGGNVL